MKRVKFKEDYAVHRVDDVAEFDNQICSHLVNIAEVADYTDEKITQHPAGREYIDPAKKDDVIEEKEDKEPKSDLSGGMSPMLPTPPAADADPTKRNESKFKK